MIKTRPAIELGLPRLSARIRHPRCWHLSRLLVCYASVDITTNVADASCSFISLYTILFHPNTYIKLLTCAPLLFSHFPGQPLIHTDEHSLFSQLDNNETQPSCELCLTSSAELRPRSHLPLVPFQPVPTQSFLPSTFLSITLPLSPVSSTVSGRGPVKSSFLSVLPPVRSWQGLEV